MNSPVTSPTPTPVVSEKTGKRKKFFTLFFLTLLLLGAGYVAYYYLVLNHFETTDDAYVGGDMVMVNAQVGGTVTQISASDNQGVETGQTLLTLDSADSEVALAEAQARLGEPWATVIAKAQAWRNGAPFDHFEQVTALIRHTVEQGEYLEQSCAT